MNQPRNQFTPDQKKALSLECYKKIKEDKISYRIKNMTVIFPNPKQFDKIFYYSIVLCDPNELLRLCSQKVN